MDSKPLTGCIKQRIFTLVLQYVIFTVKCHLKMSHFIEGSIFISSEKMEKLMVHFHIL